MLILYLKIQVLNKVKLKLKLMLKFISARSNRTCLDCAADEYNATDESLTVHIVQHLFKMYNYAYINRTSAFNGVRFRRSKNRRFR